MSLPPEVSLTRPYNLHVHLCPQPSGRKTGKHLFQCRHTYKVYSMEVTVNYSGVLHAAANVELTAYQLPSDLEREESHDHTKPKSGMKVVWRRGCIVWRRNCPNTPSSTTLKAAKKLQTM